MIQAADMPSSPYDTCNKILNALPNEDRDFLFPHLKPIQLQQRTIIEEPKKIIKRLYFPESGLLSIITRVNKQQTEVGIIGCEGLTGLAVVLGADRSPFQTFAQISGRAWYLDTDIYHEFIEPRAAIRNKFIGYAHTFMMQIAYAAHAYSRAAIEERLARWLLMAQDRTESTEVALTHEFLSLMLGVRRAGVTLALKNLAEKRLINSLRGLIVILDRDGLKAIAGESYGPTEKEYDHMFPAVGLSPISVPFIESLRSVVPLV